MSGLPDFFRPISWIYKEDRAIKRAVVLASGPSAKGFPHKTLKDSSIVTVGVNEEGHRHKKYGVPDYWIFSDQDFIERINKNGYECHPETTILIRLEAARHMVKEGLSLPEAKAVYVWSPDKRFDFHSPTNLPVEKTTSTAAIAFLCRLGAEKIFLSGVDCGWKGDRYYVDKNAERKPPYVSETNFIEFEGIKVSKMHNIMIGELSRLKREIDPDKNTVTQGCLWSPLDCFKKSTYEEWLED